MRLADSHEIARSHYWRSLRVALFAMSWSGNRAHYCPSYIRQDVSYMVGVEEGTAVLDLPRVDYACRSDDEVGEVLAGGCWLHRQSTDEPVDAVIVVRELCVKYGWPPRNCAQLMRETDKVCSILPAQPVAQQLRDQRCTPALNGAQRSYWNALAKVNGQNVLGVGPFDYGGKVYMEFANTINELNNINRVLNLIYPLHRHDGDLQFVDAGSHQGQFTRLVHYIWNSRGFAKLQARARVVAFEPISFNREHFQNWVVNDGYTNFTDIQAYALGDSVYSTEIFVSGSDGNADFKHVGSLGKWKDNPVSLGMVDVTTLDDWLRHHTLSCERITVLKIDCEGKDAEVILGALDTIDTFNIDYLVWEYSQFWLIMARPDLKEGSLHAIVELLDGIGYDSYLLGERNAYERLVDLPEADRALVGGCDVEF